MLMRTLTITAFAAALATGAMAQGGTHSSEMFKGPRIHAAIQDGTDHSKDAILPDGTINVDPTVTGSVTPSSDGTTSFSQPRMQCDSSPNTSEMRSNTFDAAPGPTCQ